MPKRSGPGEDAGEHLRRDQRPHPLAAAEEGVLVDAVAERHHRLDREEERAHKVLLRHAHARARRRGGVGAVGAVAVDVGEAALVDHHVQRGEDDEEEEVREHVEHDDPPRPRVHERVEPVAPVDEARRVRRRPAADVEAARRLEERARAVDEPLVRSSIWTEYLSRRRPPLHRLAARADPRLAPAGARRERRAAVVTMTSRRQEAFTNCGGAPRCLMRKGRPVLLRDLIEMACFSLFQLRRTACGLCCSRAGPADARPHRAGGRRCRCSGRARDDADDEHLQERVRQRAAYSKKERAAGAVQAGARRKRSRGSARRGRRKTATVVPGRRLKDVARACGIPIGVCPPARLFGPLLPAPKIAPAAPRRASAARLLTAARAARRSTTARTASARRARRSAGWAASKSARRRRRART